MSQAAVLCAVRDELQELFNLDADSCEIGFDGSPKPMAGEFYVSIHPGRWSGASGDWDLSETYEVLVTLTMRMGVAPNDRRGIAMWLANPDGGDGLETRIRKVITAIHQSQKIRAAANTRISVGGGNILTALLMSNVSAPKPQGPEWFTAAHPQTETDPVDIGVSQTITFNGCTRVQNIPDKE